MNQLYEIHGTYSLNDTILAFDENYKIKIVNRNLKDTLETSYPNRLTGYYNFSVKPGDYRIIYSGVGYFTETVDTSVVVSDEVIEMNIDMKLRRDLSAKRPVRKVYEKIMLANIPKVAEIDSSILITNMRVNDVGDTNILDSDILYYTVQVMALYNPVDVSYFKYINDMKVLYNDADKFYRYTTGNLSTREEADALRLELISKGYLDDLFIKKVSRK